MSSEMVAVTPELWCLHVLGPDDVHPAPDRATAQLWAAQWTVWNHRRNPAPDLNEPVVSWIVAEWPYDAANHAAGVAEAVRCNTFPVDPLATLTRQQAEARATSGAGEAAMREAAAKLADDLASECILLAEGSEYEDHRRDWLARSWGAATLVRRIRALPLSASPTEAPGSEGAGWRTDVDAAPRDGTPILAWCVHPNAKHADTTVANSEWQGPVVAYWTDHNTGGWVWHGLCGTFTHWMPLPAAPTRLALDEQGEG